MLLATTVASSEYKGPIITSCSFKSLATKILSIFVLFRSVSKTLNSIDTPCFVRESIAISAPKYTSVTIFASLLFVKISLEAIVSYLFVLKGSNNATFNEVFSTIES